ALAAAAVSLAGAAAAQSPVVAGVGVCCFGAASSAWGVGSVSLRQALVPDRMLGRATSAHRLITLGAGPVGAVLAGFVAHRFELRTPLWLSAVLLAVAAVVAPLLLRRVDFPGVSHPPMRPDAGVR
ncbi:MAG: MFS transporter, partial [Actinocatenispora sp.]